MIGIIFLLKFFCGSDHGGESSHRVLRDSTRCKLQYIDDSTFMSTVVIGDFQQIAMAGADTAAGSKFSPKWDFKSQMNQNFDIWSLASLKQLNTSVSAL